MSHQKKASDAHASSPCSDCRSKEILTLAVEIGDALLRSGGEIYRVEDTLFHILDAYGLAHFDVYVLSNGIFASVDEPDACSLSMIRHVPLGDVHLGKIAALNQLSREICAHAISLDAAWARLRDCQALSLPDAWMQGLSCGIGCACFCSIFGGSVLDAFCTLVPGIFLQYMRLSHQAKNVSKFMTNIVGSAFLTAASLLLLHLNLPIHPDKIVIGGIVPLLPGIALTTSIRNLFNGDYLSGAIHLLDALLTAMCIAVGVGFVIIFYQHIKGGAFLP